MYKRLVQRERTPEFFPQHGRGRPRKLNFDEAFRQHPRVSQNWHTVATPTPTKLLTHHCFQNHAQMDGRWCISSCIHSNVTVVCQTKTSQVLLYRLNVREKHLTRNPTDRGQIDSISPYRSRLCANSHYLLSIMCSLST